MSRRSIRQSEMAALESGLSLISGSLTSVHANCPKLSQPMERPVINGFERCAGERERSVSRCDALSSSPRVSTARKSDPSWDSSALYA